tara:strand:+ start:216 stop:773 length:558 start_codon:yes stop_codon:yes gene_type:complete
MGLFDNIICKLPLPVESKEGDDFDFTPYEWETRTFQTKDLDNCMVDYEIRSDGHLCVWRTNSLSGKEGRWIESDFTGYVNFYDLIRNNEGEKDLWVEFKAHFILGKIEGDIVCEEWKEEDNSNRKQVEAEFKEMFEKREEFIQKWYFRYFLSYWNILVYFLTAAILKVMNWKVKMLHKIRDKLTF